MSDKEIKISEYGVADCAGNINNLMTIWDAVPDITGAFNKSTGSAKFEANACLEETSTIKEKMSELLVASKSFLEKAGMTFEAADEGIADYYNTADGK